MTNERDALPYYDEPPSKLEVLVALVSKNATSDNIGSVHAISVRVPSIAFTTIQAVAQHSGMSMNKTIVALLDVALDQLWDGLDQEDCNQISTIRSALLGQIIAAGSVDQASKGEI